MRIRGNNKAVSIVDCLAATAIISTIMAGSIYSIVNSQKLGAYAEEKSVAIRHAQSVAEHLQYLAIQHGKEPFDLPQYHQEDGVLIDIGDEFEEYVGVPYTLALRNESIAVAFPAWDVNYYAVRDYGYVKIVVKWTSSYVPAPLQTLEFESTIRFKEGF